MNGLSVGMKHKQRTKEDVGEDQNFQFQKSSWFSSKVVNLPFSSILSEIVLKQR